MLDKENLPAPDKNAPLYKFSDEETKKKIRRHIKDINDVITEKDIKDAKVPGAEEVPVKPGKKGKKEKKDIVDDVPGNPATPWDILNK